MLDFLGTANQIKNKLRQLWSIKPLRYCIIALLAGYCIYNFTSNIMSRLGYSFGDIPQAIVSVFQAEDVSMEAQPAMEQTKEQEPSGEQTKEQEPSGEQTKEQEPSGEQTKEQEPSGEQTKEQSPDEQPQTVALAEEASNSLWSRLSSWFSDNRVKGGNKSYFDVWQGILMFWDVAVAAFPWMVGIFVLNWFCNRKKAAPLPILDNQNPEKENLPHLYTKGDSHENDDKKDGQ